LFAGCAADDFFQERQLSSRSSAPPGPTQFHSAGWWPGRQRTLAYSAQIFGAALRQRPDFILSTHVNFTPVGRWLNRLRGVRYAAVAHGLDVWGAQGRSCGRRLSVRQSACFAVSRFTRDCLVSELYLDPARVSILPNTFDAEAFGVRPKPRYLLKRFGLQPEQPVILTVGRLASAERYKGYDQILRALPAVRRAIRECVTCSVAAVGIGRGSKN
jgi:glycosyltransferase involved in cell wall biosynthesis